MFRFKLHPKYKVGREGVNIRQLGKMFRKQNRHSFKDIFIKMNLVFYNLNKISSQQKITIIYKWNLYDFFFLGDNSKYINIRGLVIKSRRTTLNNIIHGKRIGFVTRISNENTFFQLSLGLPSLHF
jgi:hypothetical protein